MPRTCCSPLGVRSVCVSHTLADAEALIERETIDAAILDIRIGRGRSDPLALTLMARGIPFIFTSGYGQACDLPAEVAAVPIVGKPYASEALVAAFAGLLAAP